MPFGNVLRAIRKQHNMTQADLAQVLGVAESAISMWELGRRNPDREMMEQIADYFNVDMDYLFGRSDIPNAYQFRLRDKSGQILAAVSDKYFKSSLRFALWGDDDNMSEEDVEDVLKYAEFVRQKKQSNK